MCEPVWKYGSECRDLSIGEAVYPPKKEYIAIPFRRIPVFLSPFGHHRHLLFKQAIHYGKKKKEKNQT
jgi:hypothetical protein